MHWKMGKLNPSQNLSGGLIYDVTENVTFIFYNDIWKPVENYQELTIWDLETFYKVMYQCVNTTYLVY
jgi:hypothetical protein